MDSGTPGLKAVLYIEVKGNVAFLNEPLDVFSVDDIDVGLSHQCRLYQNQQEHSWMRNRDVIEFLGLWERLHNSDFNPLEFEGVRKQAGANAFTMSPKKWIEATNAIGIVSKAGRYGGTYAHSDIAMSFANPR